MDTTHIAVLCWNLLPIILSVTFCLSCCCCSNKTVKKCTGALQLLAGVISLTARLYYWNDKRFSLYLTEKEELATKLD